MILLNSFLSKWTSLSQTTHAVIFMNINVLFQVVYFTVSKYSVEHYDIDPMDLSILRTGFLGIMSAIMSEAYGKKQWKESVYESIEEFRNCFQPDEIVLVEFFTINFYVIICVVHMSSQTCVMFII